MPAYIEQEATVVIIPQQETPPTTNSLDDVHITSILNKFEHALALVLQDCQSIGEDHKLLHNPHMLYMLQRFHDEAKYISRCEGGDLTDSLQLFRL